MSYFYSEIHVHWEGDLCIFFQTCWIIEYFFFRMKHLDS